MKNKEKGIKSLKSKCINNELINSVINFIQQSKKLNMIIQIDNNNIDNSKICVENIQSEFNINNKQNNGKNEYDDNLGQDEQDIEINDKNFLEMVESNLLFIKENYINKNEPEKNESKINISVKKKKVSEKKKKKKSTRRFKILKHCLNQLKYNELSLDEFLKKSPFQTRPYQLPYSLDFINAIKFDKYDKLEEYLEFPELLYSYDYYRQTGFHWAVKLDRIKSLIMMLKCGNCINLRDVNGFTPLALAAKNNNIDICQILCDSGANPLIPNNDGLIPKDISTEIKLKSYLTIYTQNYLQKNKSIKYFT